MAFTNNVMIVRHGLLAKLVRMWREDKLVENIDRLPIELSPRKSKVKGRCCVHKERAVWKYKSLPLLGFDMTDEKDELTPLSYYAQAAVTRDVNPKESILTVIDEACSSCVQVNYEITNLCRGCVARSCYMNCPKDAIHFKNNGQAEIDHDKCISCGICHQSCPYHAIVYIPVPCEDVCPVKAISKDEYGIEHIDESKCIYCGKCINACPFGAIFEISQVFDILQSIKRGEKVVAMVAPAMLAQYNAPIEPLMDHISDLLHRFTNAALGDTCQRVGGDPARKLSPEDRLIGAGKLALSLGITPSYIAVGAAAGVRRYLDENAMEQTPENARTVLSQVSGLDEENQLTEMILDMYQMILEGCPIAELRRTAGKNKAASLQNVI